MSILIFHQPVLSSFLHSKVIFTLVTWPGAEDRLPIVQSGAAHVSLQICMAISLMCEQKVPACALSWYQSGLGFNSRTQWVAFCVKITIPLCFKQWSSYLLSKYWPLKAGGCLTEVTPNTGLSALAKNGLGVMTGRDVVLLTDTQYIGEIILKPTQLNNTFRPEKL